MGEERIHGSQGMDRFICIHGHFYQPPRENPWIEEVEIEDSAYPYHDWNARITAECYAPNAASRILDANRKIIDIVSNYRSISFNFGPTLLAWLEKNNPQVYAAILEADKESMRQFSGHGAAIAQAYNHIIMPLANDRDKRTQILWGIADFVFRFGRSPEGMWLPETAADTRTLELMADEGIRFTILSPSQALRVRKAGQNQWTNTTKETLDCKRPYTCRLDNGKSIAIFFLEDAIGQELAFGRLLENGEGFGDRMVREVAEYRAGPRIASIVSDGETYGHHHRFADMALAYAIYSIQEKNEAAITVFGEYLATHPPDHEVEIRENTSWSCPHGVERWRGDCGCSTRGTTIRDGDPVPPFGLTRSPAGPGNEPAHPMHQRWRGPLREAMDRLRDELVPLYEARMHGFITDPWNARDDYISVILDRSPAMRAKFFARHARRALTGEEESQVLRLLEMQRHALLMYTSCGWFFDDISGIESVQVMQYACRAMQLAREICGIDLEPMFISYLNDAESNDKKHGNGGAIYRNYVARSKIDLNRIVFNYALSLLLSDEGQDIPVRHYTKTAESYEKTHSKTRTMICGTLTLVSDITGVKDTVEYTVVHLGSYEFMGGIRDFSGEGSFCSTREIFVSALEQEGTGDIVQAMEREFGSEIYSLWHLFRDAQRATLFAILKSTLEEQESFIRQTIYREQISLIHAMHEMRIPVPRIFEDPVSYILNRDLQGALSDPEIDRIRIQHLVSELVRGGFAVDRDILSYTISNRVAAMIKKLPDAPDEIATMEEIADMFRILSPLSLGYDLWESQNGYFYYGKKQLAFMQARVARGDSRAIRWMERFRDLGGWLGVTCS